MTTIKHIFIGHLLIILLSACGGGGSGGGDTPPEGTPNGQYDLVDYLFDKTLDVTSNIKTYQISVYAKSTGNLIFPFEYTEQFEKTLDNTIYWSTDGEAASTFVITASTIDETVHSANDAFRASQRFVDVGTEYMNASADLPPFGTQNANCKLVKHHPSIDLSTLTDTFSLTSGIYNDVLEINCSTGFVIEGQYGEHTNLTHYFVRDVGIVFSEGTVFFLGDVYFIPQL